MTRPAYNFLDPRLPMRFWDKVIPEPNSGFWLWIGAADPKGYGRFNGTEYLAHRESYSALAGEIPSGLFIDHLCRTTNCCNPLHLEPVTNQENCRRSPLMGQYKRADVCPQGHDFTPENTIYRSRGAAGRVGRREYEDG